MIFKVERLGPIKLAEIDLSKDLILLTGPNGTGKTYVAWAVYGFLQTWQGYPFTKILHDVLEPVADGLLKNGDSEFDVAAVVRHHSAEIVSTLERAYSDQIAGDFAAEEALFKSTTRANRCRRRYLATGATRYWLRDPARFPLESHLEKERLLFKDTHCRYEAGSG